MILVYELDLDIPVVNKYGRSHRHTHTTDRPLYTATKMVGN